ncbi:MAG: hypothetical protein AAEJ52_00780, partial [Myxococcota bacterium]
MAALTGALQTRFPGRMWCPMFFASSRECRSMPLEMQALKMQTDPAGKAWVAGLCATLMLCAANCSDVPGRGPSDPISSPSDGLVFVREVGGS